MTDIRLTVEGTRRRLSHRPGGGQRQLHPRQRAAGAGGRIRLRQIDDRPGADGLVRKPGVVSAERLEVLGRDVLTLSARGWRALRGNDIAMVLQDPRYALNPVQSIQTQLEEALTLHQRLSRRARAEAVKDAIAAVGLDLPVLSRYPGEPPAGWDSG